MRVCYFGTYRANYTRNQIMIEGLRRNGVEVVECHEPLWHGVQDRVQAASGGWLHPRFWWRVLVTYLRLLKKYLATPDYDLMVLGYPGQIDVFLARLLTWFKRRPLVMDAFMSIYLVTIERKLVDEHPWTARLIHGLEKGGLRLPDLLIVISKDYIQWYRQTFGMDGSRFRLLLTGADDRVYHPVPGQPDPDCFTVLYYGSYIYTHGLPAIVEAARLLRDEPGLRFVLIGRGPLKDETVEMVNRHDLQNVQFVDWVERHELPQRVMEADVCLGAFGTTPQAEITIQNKIYEGLAMGKPVITADTVAVRDELEHGEHVYLIPKEDGQALAQAVLTLRDEPGLRQRLARQGQAVFNARFTPTVLGKQFKGYLTELLGETSASRPSADSDD